MRRLLITLLALLPALADADNPAVFRPGEDALASGQWEIAALRFDRLLRDGNLTQAQRPRAAVRLVEAWIHLGNTAAALDLLRQSYVAKDPEYYFWKGQALAANGRLAEAADVFAPALTKPDLPHRNEAILSRASLQLALNLPEPALLTLKSLTTSPDPVAAAKARLRQAAILFDQGDAKAARDAIPATDRLAPEERSKAGLLTARLLLAEGKPAAAASAFTSLLDQKPTQGQPQIHAATIGLADALAAQDKPEAAAATLISFLQINPESPLIEPMFQRLLRWLPDSPELTDPILQQLSQWIPPVPQASTALGTALGTDATLTTPASSFTPDLAARALLTRAIALHRIDTPETRVEARRLLTRLRLEYPAHPLALRALLLSGQWLLDDGKTQPALTCLAAVRDLSADPQLRGEAVFLSAQAAAVDGDPKLAAKLFDDAANTLAAQAADTARLNAAVTRLSHSELITTAATNAMTPGTRADLKLEQALAATPPAAAKSALDAFLAENPDHPRATEARLAAAEAALATTPPDLANARAQLDAVEASAQDDIPPARLARAHLRIADLANEPKAAIAAAQAFLQAFPDAPDTPDVTLVLGRNLYQSGDYNPARMTLEKLAATDTVPARAQAAWLLAARAATLVPSPQSREESLNLFDKAIAIKAPLAAIARLEKARLMIDLNQLPEATTMLRTWRDSLPASDPLRLPTGFMLGQALTAQADKQPTLLTEALSLYDKLLTHPATDPATRNRIQYLRGQTLEQLPSPTNPAAKRIAEALDAYYSVFEAAGDRPPAEWEWFELCGFRALKIYEDAQRWQPAIAIAKKIASFKGPRAADADARARALQLKHMIWEE